MVTTINKLLISFTSSHWRYCTCSFFTSSSSFLLFLHWIVSVFWTLWFHYSIHYGKSLSWSWGLSPVRFRQLASRPAPVTEDRYSATFGVIRVQLLSPGTCLWPACDLSFQHFFTHTHKLEFCSLWRLRSRRNYIRTQDFALTAFRFILT